MFRRNKPNKAKLEHKLYLARESPEPIFDVSDCQLQNVPSGIYALCKVFLKETLKLDHNRLNSLSGGGNLNDLCFLKILDISYNEFSVIPDEINLLTSLTEFYIHNNRLKKLPENICKLEKLKILDVSSNNLKQLPIEMGDLKCLTQLKLTNNGSINNLPKSICRLSNLIELDVDCDNFVYPPAFVMKRGTSFVLKYICEDTGYNYEPPKRVTPTASKSFDSNSDLQEFQAKIWELEKIKERKVKKFLEIERQNELAQAQELELAQATKLNRGKLLADLTKQQIKLDSELSRLQQEKEMERFQLVEQLQEAEQNADIAIRQLLSMNSAMSGQLLEMEKSEEERLLNVATQKYDEILSKNNILINMQALLEQETEQYKKFCNERSETVRSILEQEMNSDEHLLRVLSDNDLRKSELVEKIEADNELQKAAVATLLERGDSRSWSLLQQVRLVESQLSALTAIEMDRRKLKMDDHLNDLADKRVSLSTLLMDLLEKQNDRRSQLLSTLQNLENRQDSEEDFWLKRYQDLLEHLPQGLSKAQKNIDPGLAEILLLNGVIHCLPFLAKLLQSKDSLENVTEEDLSKSGVILSEDRTKILEAFTCYSKRTLEYPTPSAPPIESVEASAPPVEKNMIHSGECVVCMDNECHTIFVPCGHLCCCSGCSATLTVCPLCRGQIQHKIRVMPP